MEFWLRCLRGGAKYQKINEIMGTYYFNPEGQSTKSAQEARRSNIESEIKRQYSEALLYSGARNGDLSYIWVPA
jgi:hypothetical protein